MFQERVSKGSMMHLTVMPKQQANFLHQCDYGKVVLKFVAQEKDVKMMMDEL